MSNGSSLDSLDSLLEEQFDDFKSTWKRLNELGHHHTEEIGGRVYLIRSGVVLAFRNDQGKYQLTERALPKTSG